MHMHMQQLERLHQPFQGVGQGGRRGGVGQETAARYQTDDPQGDEYRRDHPPDRDVEYPPIHQDVAAVHKEDIDNRRKKDEGEDRLDAFPHQFQRQAGQRH